MMDFHMDLGVIDDLIGKLKWGVDKLDAARKRLHICMGLCEDGGFSGQSGDKAAALIAHKLTLIFDLMNTYMRAIEVLELAKHTAVEIDQELVNRIKSI